MRAERVRLLPHEWCFGLFLVVMWLRLAAAAGAFASDALVFLALIAINAGVIAAAERWPTRGAWTVRLLYYAIAMNVAFQQLRSAIPALHPTKADGALQEIDRHLVGGNLSVALQPWVTPLATELLSLCYLLFFPYLLFSMIWYLSSALELAKKFWAGLFSLYGIGFLGYSLVPAAGPYLAMAGEFTVPLEGWRLTQWNDTLVRLGSNGVDVFPSLHCAVSAYFLAFDFFHRRWRFWIYLVPALGLWVSTIYLRYHYFVDLVAGFALAAASVAIAMRYGRHGPQPKEGYVARI
jgi:membrane-associated phospholipid phosphatase